MIEIGENAKIKEKVQIQIEGRELADLNVVKAKVAEIKKLTPSVVETLKETKEILVRKRLSQQRSQKRLKFKLFLQK